ncbi:AQG_2a_G0026790.mRNA.1.CDS.1 [Saccharomyces cerevisiae]|uniref:Amino acid vacuolar transport n=1 Tax=Saccharomyces cerevisiae (strain YJM789) TaxID=307796 RepID=A6ZVI9_YEAS7|nr:Avt7p [Saccharomyces cerevisiae YJM193]AJR37214.1 Avt7p [Saccharomyces cerevisiae YJM244]AJR37796.1 Avt7p [Saccharomyces cerevisiae YJM271]AJR37989.1 Avt7p [Saccharomyces cerevisiae YJM320]AJR38554.1 Avt7p [Saccharomyces cerevisiae YJM450]AJR38745.1 Avt7p [Saccharomyces cerevisiae YJM451]AJR38939.1 Avt7p [Saccharomyces cerevisiae YJM453]AJR39510.1 Avt7p [Saccharomyces cerevisiae YJM541]AJR39689.1 Avt7p [Saccharomyces cerevisiae YJM554]AJR39869.1 Avt7p [Saccharomyces cerevisiae YJM555]A
MEATSSALSSTANLVKTIVGAGTLAIPYSFKSDGVLVGVILTLLAAVTSGLGLFVLSKCSKTLINPRNSSFFTLCMLTYPTLAPIFDLAMIVQCFGVGLSYLVLIGDLFPGLFGGERNYWIIASAVIIIPLCLVKKLDQLKYSSILGLFALAYISILVFSHFVFELGKGELTNILRNDICWWKIHDFKGLLSTFSIIIFAFTGSMNLFPMINELKDNSMENITFVINNSISLSTALFLIVGLSGYLTFGNETLGNLMLNYDPNSIWIVIGKFCLGSMLILSFPLLFHPLRIAVNNVIIWIEITYGGANPEEDPQVSEYTRASNLRPISMTVEDPAQPSDALDATSYNEQECLLPNGNFDNGSIESQENNNDERGTMAVAGDNVHHAPFVKSRFYWITALLLISMYTLALSVQSFALVLSFVGATGSTSISFTLPGLLGYKLIGSDSLAIGKMIPPKDRFYKRCSLLLVFYGLSVMFLSLYVTVFNRSDEA